MLHTNHRPDTAVFSYLRAPRTISQVQDLRRNSEILKPRTVRYRSRGSGEVCHPIWYDNEMTDDWNVRWIRDFLHRRHHYLGKFRNCSSYKIWIIQNTLVIVEENTVTGFPDEIKPKNTTENDADVRITPKDSLSESWSVHLPDR